MKKLFLAFAVLAVMAMIVLASSLLVGGFIREPTDANNEKGGVPRDRTQPMSAKRNVAIFIHEGVELLDFSGPGEVFASAGRSQAFNVYTVAASVDEITSQGFVKIKPQYTLANCPPPDVIILPGGRTDVPLSNSKVIEWIKKSSERTEIMMSVCTGAFLLAESGLLDGKEATTHWSAIESLKQQAPKTTVRENRRFVDNGKVVTAAGVSAGIDAALHVVDRLLGREAAQKTARYMEYKWEPED
jgi:transcriptional regulator GlxA family with amidase domain